MYQNANYLYLLDYKLLSFVKLV